MGSSVPRGENRRRHRIGHRAPRTTERTAVPVKEILYKPFLELPSRDAAGLPLFSREYKIYAGTIGDEGVHLAKTIEAVREQLGAEIVVAPQTPDIYRIAEERSLRVVAQSVDAPFEGHATGRISLPTVAAAGAEDVIVNDAANRGTLAEVERTVPRCADLGLESIVCVDGLEMGRAALAFGLDCFVLEKPDDIATDRPISRTTPERVQEFVTVVADENPRTRVLGGGGTSTARDVEQAFEIGGTRPTRRRRSWRRPTGGDGSPTSPR